MSKRRLADVPETIGPIVFGVGVGWVMIRWKPGGKAVALDAKMWRTLGEMVAS